MLTEGLRTTNGSRSLGDWAPDVDSGPGGAAARGRRDRGRQDEHARVGDAARHRARALRPGAQPVGPGADHRRLLRRQRRRRRGRHGRRWRTATTPAARSGSRRRAAASSGSSRPASACRSGPELAAFEGFGVDGVLTRTVRDTALALDVLAGDGPSTPLGPPLPHPSFAEAARLRAAPAADPALHDRAGRRRGRAGVRRRRPPRRRPARRRSGTRSTSGRPTGQDPEFAGHWMAAGAAMFQALDRALRRAGRPRSSTPQQMEPATRAVLDGAGHARGARTRRPRG